MSMLLAQDAAANGAYVVWAFILLAAAIGLLFVELFVPSGGLIGVMAGIAAIGSVAAFFKYDTTWGFAAGGSYIVLTPIIVVFLFKIWLNSPLAKRMILGAGPDLDEANTEESAMASEHARTERLAKLRDLIGAEGVTETALRPVGIVKIDGQRLDAMAESGIIEAGDKVIVSDVYDNQIKVRPV